MQKIPPKKEEEEEKEEKAQTLVVQFYKYLFFALIAYMS